MPTLIIPLIAGGIVLFLLVTVTMKIVQEYERGVICASWPSRPPRLAALSPASTGTCPGFRPRSKRNQP